VGHMLDTDLVFVVAGSSSGIAAEVIRDLQKRAVVIPLLRQDSPRADKLKAAKTNAVFVDYFTNHFDEIEARLSKPIRICFINFIAHKDDKLFLHHTLNDFRHSFEVNVLTNIEILRYLIPKMIAKNWGRILFVSSTRGARGDTGTSCYSCAKSALSGLSGSLGREYARFGITSNILSLGYFDSPMFHALTDARRKELIRSVPSRAVGSAADIAVAINMAVDCSYLNARTINLDGGAE